MCKSTNLAPEIKPIDRKKRNQGMHWISDHKRLAIYLRDGLACCYCGNTVTSGAQLTLDHILPHSHGGSNKETNLVTCCLKCNSSRGNRSVEEFVKATAAYINHGITAKAILKHINKCVASPLDTKYAKTLVDRQGSCFKALQNL